MKAPKREPYSCMATKRVSVKKRRWGISFFFFSSIFLISSNSTVRRKRSVWSQEIVQGREVKQSSQATSIHKTMDWTWLYSLYDVVHRSRDQRCSFDPLLPWLYQPLASLHCPSPQGSRRSCRFLLRCTELHSENLFRPVLAIFQAQGPRNQPMQQ